MKTLLVGIIGSMFILSSGISSAASTTESSYKRGSLTASGSASGAEWNNQSTTTRSWKKTGVQKGRSTYRDSQASGNRRTGGWNRNTEAGTFVGTNRTTDAGRTTKQTIDRGSAYKGSSSISATSASGKYKRKTR